MLRDFRRGNRGDSGPGVSVGPVPLSSVPPLSSNNPVRHTPTPRGRWFICVFRSSGVDGESSTLLDPHQRIGEYRSQMSRHFTLSLLS